MRIVHVSKYYPPVIGGVEVHVRTLAEEQARRGFAVSVLVCNTGSETVEEEIRGVRVIRCAAELSVSSAPVSLELVRRLRGIPADVLHFHHPYPPGELALLVSGRREPTVVTYHSDIVRQRVLGAMYRGFLHRFLRRMNRVILTSPHLAASRHLQPYRDKCVPVALGLDASVSELTPEQAAFRDRLRGHDGPPLILFVGRMSYYKGIDFLLDAMRQVDARLMLVTSGGGVEEMRAKIHALGLADRIEVFTGVTDEEMPAFFAACDVFTLPSIEVTEAFGLVMVEAFFAGKPVVSTDLPTGVTYVNRHEVTGLTVPPRDAAALAAALRRLVQDEALRHRLGAQGRRRALDLFTRERMTDGVMQVYDEVITEVGHPTVAPAAPQRRWAVR